MRDLVGFLLQDLKGVVLGTITHQFQDDGQWFAVVDGSYEVNLAGCEEIIDLVNGGTFIRLGNHA